VCVCVRCVCVFALMCVCVCALVHRFVNVLYMSVPSMLILVNQANVLFTDIHGHPVPASDQDLSFVATILAHTYKARLSGRFMLDWSH
jgi:hypothetical protein